MKLHAWSILQEWRAYSKPFVKDLAALLMIWNSVCVTALRGRECDCMGRGGLRCCRGGIRDLESKEAALFVKPSPT
jgi:hypothetical protein